MPYLTLPYQHPHFNAHLTLLRCIKTLKDAVLNSKYKTVFAHIMPDNIKLVDKIDEQIKFPVNPDFITIKVNYDELSIEIESNYPDIMRVIGLIIKPKASFLIVRSPTISEYRGHKDYIPMTFLLPLSILTDDVYALVDGIID